MKRIILGAIVLSSVLFGADYTQKSNQELIDIAGTMEPKEVPSYFDEIEKRIQEMTLKEAREFKTQIRVKENQVYDLMKVKDFEARQKAIREVMKNHKPFKAMKCGKCDKHNKGAKNPPAQKAK